MKTQQQTSAKSLSAIGASRTNPETRAARLTRVGVRVGRETFPSVASAIAEFAPHKVGSLIAIRLRLKAAGEVVVDGLDGKPVRFVAVPR